MKLLIVGPPGSGKGTLCESIVRDYGLVHLSGGDILRGEIKKGSKLGLEAAGLMKEGKLVPDDVMVGLMLNRLSEPDAKQGVLLDGFPRTAAQAKALTDAGLKFDAMIVLGVSDAALMERSSGRRLDPSTGTIYHLKFKPPPENVKSRLVIRPDDTEEKMKYRIQVYNNQKNALVKHFSSIVIDVSAEQPIPAVYKEFTGKMQQKRLRTRKQISKL